MVHVDVLHLTESDSSGMLECPVQLRLGLIEVTEGVPRPTRTEASRPGRSRARPPAALSRPLAAQVGGAGTLILEPDARARDSLAARSGLASFPPDGP